MKKFLLILYTLIIIISISFSQDTTNDSSTVNNISTNSSESEYKDQIFKIQNELNSLRKDIEMLKKRTEWFTFNLEGSIKVIYGVNLWAREDYEKYQAPYFNKNTPITHGFDFDNNIRMSMLLGNKIISSSTSKGDYGTEITLALKIQSKAISEIKPEGSWYVVSGADDKNNPVDIYFPRYESGGSNILFGNFEIAVSEAKVKNILGSGFFLSYLDIMEVHNYYGISGISEVFKLNNEYFNNGFVRKDNSGDQSYASLYYSFDDDDYEPASEVPTAVQLWSNSMLHYNPNDEDFNQDPHGISFGYDKSITDGFDLFVEFGVSSKDAFDPKYFTDKYIDYGFFIKGEPRFFNKRLEFHPKLNLSFAFQTETTDDVDTQFSTFAMGFSLPLYIYFKTHEKDRLKLEFNVNLNVNIVFAQVSTLLSFLPELTILKERFFFSLPIIYSFKNRGRGGFQRIGHSDVAWIDQLYDDHIFNMGFILGFNSTNLFGNTFQYKITNSIYFTYIKPYEIKYYKDLYYSDKFNLFEAGEYYFFEVLRNDFIFHDIGPKQLNMYFEFGLGYTKNAKVLFENTNLKYIYDRERDTWVDTMYGKEYEWLRWGDVVVLSFKTGFSIDIIDNFGIGFDVESPKLLLNTINPIGNQQSYGLFKLWSEIKL